MSEKSLVLGGCFVRRLVVAVLVVALFVSGGLGGSRSGVVLAAEDPEFRLEMDSLVVEQGVQTRMIISLVNAPNVSNIEVAGMENFSIVSQTSSTSTTVVNNETRTQVDVIVTLIPQTLGPVTLKAYIQMDNVTYETNELQVTITDEANPSSDSPELIVKTHVSHTEAYLGEKVVITYDLFTRVDIESLGFPEYLTVDGAMLKELPEQQMATESVYIDGYRYTRYEIKKVVMDPIRTGTLRIPAGTLQVNVFDSNGGNGGFGGMFRSTVTRDLQTEEATILIKGLPTEGRPADFSGIVGFPEITGEYSREALDFGDSLALRVSISGNCNLDGLKNIVNGNIPGFTVYESEKENTESIMDNRYHVHKEFEMILIPEKTGDIKVQSVGISFFNTITEKYETAKIPDTVIQVSGEMTPIHNGSVSQADEYETVLIQQVNYELPDDGIVRLSVRKDTLTIVGIVLLLMLAGGAVGLTLFLRHKSTNPEQKALRKQIAATSDVYELYNLFNTHIKLSYGVNVKASSRQTVSDRLPDSAAKDLILEIMDFMESPAVAEANACAELKKKILSALKNGEKR